MLIMKKKIVATLIVSMIMMTGCGSAVTDNATTAGSTEAVTNSIAVTEATTPEQTTENNKEYEAIMDFMDYPSVDGSTACLPLMAKVMSRTTGIKEEEAQLYVNASKTANSWRNIVNGGTDVLLVYEMPDSVREEVEASGVELTITPIGRDALVFIENEQNPVNNLTKEQILDIYTGKITNWSEVGGDNKEIVAFQRDTTSGSQTLFDKLIKGDAELMEAPTELKPGMMGGLIEGIADYNNSGNAIGYSVYYYVSEMYSQPGLKLISVDGVMPGFDTIADNSYKYTNEFYAVIRSAEPEDSKARALYNWIISKEGYECLKDTGYVPVNKIKGEKYESE